MLHVLGFVLPRINMKSNCYGNNNKTLNIEYVSIYVVYVTIAMKCISQ